MTEQFWSEVVFISIAQPKKQKFVELFIVLDIKQVKFSLLKQKKVIHLILVNGYVHHIYGSSISNILKIKQR